MMGIDVGYFYAPYVPMLRNVWNREFVLWPRRCELSNKLLWLTYAYHCVRHFREDMQIFTKPTNKWHSAEAHTFYLLTND